MRKKPIDDVVSVYGNSESAKALRRVEVAKTKHKERSMKIALSIAAVLVVLVVGVVVIGALLPKHHVASRSAVFRAPAPQLLALISGAQEWRPDVKICEVFGKDGRTFQRETSQHGQTVMYELQGSQPPNRIERRIATEGLPYAGTWTFDLEPTRVNGLAPGQGTRVRITEDGEVYNPVFRFVSKFIMGQTATQDAYLKAMGKATGEEIHIED